MQERESVVFCNIFVILYHFVDTVVSHCMKYIFVTIVSYCTNYIFVTIVSFQMQTVAIGNGDRETFFSQLRGHMPPMGKWMLKQFPWDPRLMIHSGS